MPPFQGGHLNTRVRLGTGGAPRPAQRSWKEEGPPGGRLRPRWSGGAGPAGALGDERRRQQQAASKRL